MLGLFEEALIQYDEIDALLTQLVINSKFGGDTCLQNNCSYLCTPLAIAHSLFNYHLLAEFYLKFPSNNDFQSPIFF